MAQIKAVIFDWGRTLYDNETKDLFPESRAVLEYCAKKYALAIASIKKEGPLEDRFDLIRQLDIAHHFRLILIHPEEKEVLFRNAIANLGCAPEEVVVVDDRVARLAWPIKNGCKVVWVRKGKFSGELPTEESGFPSHTIENLGELIRLV